MIRVRWERAGHFKAVSMDLRGRVDAYASSTSSAERAVKACAGKALACREDDVTILPSKRPNKPIGEVTTLTATGDWHALECAVKGSSTQLELLPGGAS